MIGSRLQAPVSVYKVFEHISTALAEDKVVVFIVQRGKHVTLEDPASLFLPTPSSLSSGCSHDALPFMGH